MSSVVVFHEAVALLGRFPALSGLTLTVDEGEIVLLRGPNGAGKTSVLRAAAGLLAVTSGRAAVLGHDLRVDRRGVRRHVGLLGHQNHLYGDLTVFDNLRFRARSAGATDADIAEVADRLELPARLRKVSADRLSAGQRRRVAVAAVLLRRPRLWLLDEPHAGLDQRGRTILDTVLRDAASAGATVLFASHELDRASQVADRVVDVVGGHVVEASGGDHAE